MAFLVKGLRPVDELMLTRGVSAIYIAAASLSGPVKIGKTNAPTRRLASLQTGNAEELHIYGIFLIREGIAFIEGQAHRAFRKRRLVGEWFDSDVDTAREMIRSVAPPGTAEFIVQRGDTANRGHKGTNSEKTKKPSMRSVLKALYKKRLAEMSRGVPINVPEIVPWRRGAK